MWLTLVALAVQQPPATAPKEAPRPPEVSFKQEAARLDIAIGGKPFAAYVFKDDVVRRPYLAHVRNPDGVQVTRNHPPVKGKDPTDHDTMHPGIWLAFGDLGGADFWRNKGLVRHAGFVDKPKGGKGEGTFAVRNRYEAGGKVVCEEVCRVTVRVGPRGYLVVWESTFRGKDDFAFGDQEEMGLGVRVATPLSVKRGGTITDSLGRKNEPQVWGKQADWCDYRGRVDRRTAGVLLMSDPGNFRRSWFHARDYGLLVANPFGRNAFTRGEKSRVAVKAGGTLRLRFGVLVYGGPVNRTAAYHDFLRAIKAFR
jgi:hypothetical protein